MANRITAEKKRQIIELLVEGNSCRSTARIAGVELKTVLRNIVVVGEGCRKLMDNRMRGLKLEHLQIDEITTFCGKKQKRLKPEEKGNPRVGEQWLFFGIDEKTKLIPCHFLGKRTQISTDRFMNDLARRIVKPELNGEGFRPQISTDGLGTYAPAIDMVFANTVRYGQIVKTYKTPDTARYAPLELNKAERKGIHGIDDLWTICTSHVERANLTVRTFMKRFTRLALGFSRKWENLNAAIHIHFAYHNFCWVHGTLHTSPAVAAGLCSAPWTLEELLNVIEMF